MESGYKKYFMQNLKEKAGYKQYFVLDDKFIINS
jgi:hypothetical protein